MKNKKSLNKKTSFLKSFFSKFKTSPNNKKKLSIDKRYTLFKNNKFFKTSKPSNQKSKNSPKTKENSKHIPFPKNDNKGKKSSLLYFDLSIGNIAKITFVVLLIISLFTFLNEISGIIFMFFISFLLASAVDPLVDKLQTYHIPRWLSMLFIYVVIFYLIGFFIGNVVTLVVEQVAGIASSVGVWISDLQDDGMIILPSAHYLQPILNQFLDTVDFVNAASQVQSTLNLVKDWLINISVGLFNLIIVLALTFFITVEEESIDHFFLSLFPSKYGKYISFKMQAVKDQIGLWLRGQLYVSIIAGLISYIGLVVMGVDYALTLSLISGICMVVPVVGRFVAWLIAFPIVFNQDPMLSLWMSIFYLAVQQIENNVLVPKIMNKAVGLSPIIIIFAMMIGFQYFDILGLIFSIPIATTIALFLKDYQNKEK